MQSSAGTVSQLRPISTPAQPTPLYRNNRLSPFFSPAARRNRTHRSIVMAWRFWSTTWDDSAITLGFARTFALTEKSSPLPAPASSKAIPPHSGCC